MNSCDSTRKLVVLPSHDLVSNAIPAPALPIQFAALVDWANERQQQIIEFQNDQIEALLEKLGMKRVLLTDDQRRVLAVKGREFGAGPRI